MEENALQILKQNGLKTTQNRKDILVVLLQSKKAFSLLDLENLLGKKHDRSSIFRSLQVFVENRILEKFTNSNGVSVYTIETDKNDINNHSHFKCNDCETIISLPKLPETYLAILGNNKIEITNLLLEGSCEQCQNKNEK